MARSCAFYYKSTLEKLKKDYNSGKLTMRELMEKVDLGPTATYEDYCEIFESLID